jgi:hypothetical protein
MNRIVKAALLLVAVTGVASADPGMAPTYSGSYENRFFTGEITTGYYGGIGLKASGTMANFADGFPFQVRFGLGYAWVAPGDAVRARRVFINQDTQGSPTGNAKTWDASVDVMYPIHLFSLKRSRLFVGARHSNFTAHFEYIGGNETFDVNNNPWGVGGGVETAFALSPRVDMITSLGADYYFHATLSGHDTYYYANGSDLHGKENFTYKDADNAIKQPDLRTRILFGIAYRF